MLKLGNITNTCMRRVCICLALVILLFFLIIIYLPCAVIGELFRAWNNLVIISEFKLRLTELYDVISESW